MSVAMVQESPKPRQPKEESTAAAGDLGNNEQAVLATDGSVVVPEAMTGTTRSSRVEAGLAGNAPESRAVKPVVPEGQTALPEAS